jgi:hypothetical protein
MCHQSVGLIQSIIEKAGIPTAFVTLLQEVTERVDPPRTLFVDVPFWLPTVSAELRSTPKGDYAGDVGSAQGTRTAGCSLGSEDSGLILSSR